MTCIVGLEDGERVWIAGDSEWSSKRVKSNSVEPKVWVRDGVAWGMAGDGRPGDVLRFGPRLPAQPKKTAFVAEWIATELAPAIRAELTKENVQGDWSALVGVRGELWEIDSDLAAMRATDGYAAAGCAQTAALVGLSLTSKLSPKARLVRVVSACSRHVPGVGGKITVVTA